MRLASHIGVAYVILVITGAVWPVLPFQVVAPNIAIVFAAYLGITARGRITDPTIAALMIGWLADLLTGTPRGLTATICGVTCILSRVTTTRLLVRGWVFIASLAGVSALLAYVLTIAIRAYFSPHMPFAIARHAIVAVGSAFLTAVVAPGIFRLCRSVDSRFARTEREREAVREGYLN
jgi:hypothetical protein